MKKTGRKLLTIFVLLSFVYIGCGTEQSLLIPERPEISKITIMPAFFAILENTIKDPSSITLETLQNESEKTRIEIQQIAFRELEKKKYRVSNSDLDINLPYKRITEFPGVTKNDLSNLLVTDSEDMEPRYYFFCLQELSGIKFDMDSKIPYSLGKKVNVFLKPDEEKSDAYLFLFGVSRYESPEEKGAAWQKHIKKTITEGWTVGFLTYFLMNMPSDKDIIEIKAFLVNSENGQIIWGNHEVVEDDPLKNGAIKRIVERVLMDMPIK